MYSDSLDTLVARLDRAFERWPVVPFHALQYRLAEVGRGAMEPRWLANALSRLVSAETGSGSSLRSSALEFSEADRTPSLLEPVPHLYTLGAATTDELSRAARTIQHISEHDADAALWGVARIAGSALSKAAGGRAGRSIIPPSATPVHLAGPAYLPRPEVVLHHRPRSGPPIHLWLTQELPWIAPDDPRLWRAVFDADDAGARLLLVVRKADRALFPVLQRIGGAAVQTWQHTLETSRMEELRADAERIAWIPTRTLESLSSHAVWDQLGARARAAGAPATATMREAIAAARRHFEPPGEHTGRTAPVSAPSRLLAWASEVDVMAPGDWWDLLESWATTPATQEEPRVAPNELGSTSADVPTRAAERTSVDQPARRDAPTEVVRIGVAAEVDRATWHELRERGRPRREPS